MRIGSLGAASLLLVACGTSTSSVGNAAGGANGGASVGGTSTGGASGGGTSTGGASIAGASGGGAQSGDCVHDGDGRTTLAFVNRCAKPVTFAGSDIQGSTLASGALRCIDVGNATDAISSKRYWGYSESDPGAGKYSLAEFTFNTDFQDFDWYNISYVDAFNLPLQIVPLARSNCKTLTCATDLLSACPEVGRFELAGKLVACVNPDRNDGSNPVARYFESCDDAYAWSGDDQNGSDPSPVRACAGEDWQIVFCPSGGG